ncbi:unnamed protein product [Echinostoma caproni]|uniref:Peptidase_M16_C domain-containing protein n=1 Tax=Echinostoma caproni TaxID=27848 RepID=A0A183B5P6_9TREM|nr:unnamed protein product [Echinostoma caproni]
MFISQSNLNTSSFSPSFYTYGDANLEWCLERLDSNYLQNYDAITLDNSVPLEASWDKPRSVKLTCEPDPMAPDPDRQCTVSLSYRLEDIRNVYPNFVLNLLTKLLLDGDNAPLYQGLIESGYGLDWAGPVCGMDQGARTTSFHVGVQGVRVEDLDQFTDRVRDILAGVVRSQVLVSGSVGVTPSFPSKREKKRNGVYTVRIRPQIE